MGFQSPLLSPINDPVTAAVRRWDNILNTGFPLVGEWLREVAFQRLKTAAQKGIPLAAYSLANAAAAHPDPNIRTQSLKVLKTALPAACQDAVWQSWYLNRSFELTNLLVEKNKTAAAPKELFLVSSLFLNQTKWIPAAGPEYVSHLIQASRDQDPQISAPAHQALLSLRNQRAVNELCLTWVNSRNSSLEKVITEASYLSTEPPSSVALVALKFDHPEKIIHGEAALTSTLVNALSDRDPQISAAAALCLRNLQNPPIINELCRVWKDSRNPLLREAILQARYLPSHPVQLRALIALLTGRSDLARQSNPQTIPFLFKCLGDSDETIRANARDALLNLTHPESREYLCGLVLKDEDSLAQEFCLAANYLPADDAQRALFLFLTEQWETCIQFDFELRHLKTIFSTSTPVLRKRILQKIQRSGRPEFLSLLADSNTRSSAQTHSEEDDQIMVQMLTQNQKWQSLWNLAHETPLALAVEIIRQLTQTDWQPQDVNENIGYAQIVELLSQISPRQRIQDVISSIPFAVLRATVKINSRINALSYHPHRPVLAIGAGSGRGLLWNYQTGKIEHPLNGFSHSIGYMLFTASGELVCAERASTQTETSLSIYDLELNRREIKLPASITGLALLGENRLVVSSRDHTISVWDLHQGIAISSEDAPFWARGLVAIPERGELVALHEKISLLRISDLRTMRSISVRGNHRSGIQNSIPHHAAYLPEKDALLVGQNNGQLILVQGLHAKHTPVCRLAGEFPGPITGLFQRSNQSSLLVSEKFGKITWLDSQDFSITASMQLPEIQTTSLALSPDDNFLAVGSVDSGLSLLDLRTQNLPAILAQPLSAILPRQMALISLFEEDPSVPAEVQVLLKIAENLLQQRFRYEIEISPLPMIKSGEFDIYLDEFQEA